MMFFSEKYHLVKKATIIYEKSKLESRDINNKMWEEHNKHMEHTVKVIQNQQLTKFMEDLVILALKNEGLITNNQTTLTIPLLTKFLKAKDQQALQGMQQRKKADLLRKAVTYIGSVLQDWCQNSEINSNKGREYVEEVADEDGSDDELNEI